MNLEGVWGDRHGEALENTIGFLKSTTAELTDDAPGYLPEDGSYDEDAFACERNIALKAIALGIQALVLQAERQRAEENAEWVAVNVGSS